MTIPPKRPCEIYIFPMNMSKFCVLFQCSCHSSYALIMRFQTVFNNRQFLKCTFCYTEIISPPRMFLPLDILFGLWPVCFVASAVRGCFGLWPSWSVALLVFVDSSLWSFSVCGRLGCVPFWVWPLQLVTAMRHVSINTFHEVWGQIGVSGI